MNKEILKEQIKRHEGEVLEVYADSLGYLTLGVGHLIKEGDALRKDFIERSIKALKEKYREEGLFNAVITYKIEKIKGTDKQVKVIFIIDEGEEIAVRKISILGAKKIYDKELKSFMETAEKSILKDGTFQTAIYEQDKAKIIAYYKQNGYIDAQIIEDLVEYEWVNPEKKDERGIFITIKLAEGDIYYFDGGATPYFC